MHADDVLAILTCLESAGIIVWLDGGWGVDALLGEETRPHDDLDIVMAMGRLNAAREALRELGFMLAVDALPTRCIFGGPMDRRIDVHPVTFDRDGGGIQHQPDGGTFRYPPEGLTGTGMIAGHPVHCLTAALQLCCHLAYEPDKDDCRDMRRLCARFGLILPDSFSRTSSL
ncbi:MAG: amino acid transporter [Thermomicrobia bacterium]|nr:amino acid transporter [Thermomicrobia bacterium]